jgi:hypothetical protein
MADQLARRVSAVLLLGQDPGCGLSDGRQGDPEGPAYPLLRWKLVFGSALNLELSV